MRRTRTAGGGAVQWDAPPAPSSRSLKPSPADAAIGGGGLRSLLAAGGGGHLYSGVLGNLAGVAPATGIFVAVYEPVKARVAASADAHAPFAAPLCAAALAGLLASLVRVPTEVVKSRLQTREFVSAHAALRAILAKEGVKGLYAGYRAFMLRDVPFDTTEFVAYEALRRGVAGWTGRQPGPSETSLIGAVAGGATGIVTTPFDVLKTRLMTQGASGRYTGVLHAATTIARDEGIGAFMRGWQPRLLWISLGGFVFFPVLEAGKELYKPPPPSR